MVPVSPSGGDFDVLAKNGAVFVLAPRVTYDVEIVDGFYLSPFGRAGVAFATNGSVGFDLQFGLGTKLLLNDKFLVTLQPLGIEILAGSGGVGVGYNLLFGGGMTF